MKRFGAAAVLLAVVAASALAQQPLPALQSQWMRVAVTPDGQVQMTDLGTKLTWSARLGQVAVLEAPGKRINCDLTGGALQAKDNAIVATFNPVKSRPGAALAVTFRLVDDGRALAIGYEPSADLNFESFRLIDYLETTAADKGYVIVPTRMGLMIPADSGAAFAHNFRTSEYEGCHMNMVGLSRAGSTMLISWDDPEVAAEIKSALPGAGGAPATQTLTTAMVLRKSARSIQIRLCGKGDWNSLAASYRNVVAQPKGLRVTWDQKIKENPVRAKYIGASNVKLWACLSRQMNDESTKEEKVKVNWTFDEAAQVAEHIKNDLKIDEVLFTLGGWIHRGYDNQHPDVLPAAPECGGNDAFAAACKRILNTGYLLSLHDNYQDMYKDAPSWNEKYLQRNPDGSPTRGGKWAGGRAWFTCSKMALELAQRPQNLQAVQKLTGANSYFIDTTYAVGLQECSSKEHPLTRADDLHWKSELSDYARKVFGTFGSECGREWAIPHADFFEGLTGVSGGHFHDAGLMKKVGGVFIPFFEIVYRDCIALYGKYGYDIHAAAPYVLHHISMGRPLNYHSMPQHLYWKDLKDTFEPVKLAPSIASFEQSGPRKFKVTYAWDLGQPLTRDYKIFVHFVDAKDAIKFQNDQLPKPGTSQWAVGMVKQGPFDVTVPQGLAGGFDVVIGMYEEGASERVRMAAPQDRLRRVRLGRLTIEGDTIRLEAAKPAAPTVNAAMYVRADDGWAAGLHPADRFLKNTHEILSPLYAATARAPMTSFEFLTPDRNVRRTVFGDGASAIVNLGATDYRLDTGFGPVVLPPMGFFVEMRGYVGFCATSFGGLSYPTPACFTIRSPDGQPLGTAKTMRIFHAFGAPKLRWFNREFRVERETVVDGPNK